MQQMNEKRKSTGIQGLDYIMKGGFIPGSTNLVRGGPGTGKTIMGLHFLFEGTKNNENVLFITLGEQVAKIEKHAALLNINTSKIQFLDLSPKSDFFEKVETYDIFTPADVEREPTTKKIIEIITTFKPSRIFIDAMTHFKFLYNNNFQFYQQTLSFLHFLQESNATILFTTENSPYLPDDDLQFISDCVINLTNFSYGRYIEIKKCRDSDYAQGTHAFKISNNGITVFPKLVPLENPKKLEPEIIKSGVSSIDKLLNGGIESGTINIISGHTGSGKTTLAIQFACNLAKNNSNVALYTFEEKTEMLINRFDKINIPIREYHNQKKLHIFNIEPLLYSADEFAQIVFNHTQELNLSMIILDSISGYKLSLLDKNLISKIHSFCKYFQNLGITVFLINEIEKITGEFNVTEKGISYLADNIIFIRYLEINGQLSKAIGVLKKRMSNIESNLRKFEITENGIVVGEPLSNLRGILSGTPTFINSKDNE